MLGVLRDRVAEVTAAADRLEAAVEAGETAGIGTAMRDVRRQVDGLREGLAALEPQGATVSGNAEPAGS